MMLFPALVPLLSSLLGSSIIKTIASSTVFSVLVPIVQIVGAVLKITLELIVDLSKSREGRYILAALLATGTYIYVNATYEVARKGHVATLESRVIDLERSLAAAKQQQQRAGAPAPAVPSRR